MEIMQKTAKNHGLVCLLHEKPFMGVTGSGKHNNWSIATDTGMNLLTPGETPYENAQFLLFLCAVIKAVDEYQDLLRISAATAGNDHRLGAHEAPPAVISIFLGDELSAVIDALETDTHYDPKESTQLKLGVDVLPRLPKDNTDRNRTSPFAFTGNKFEFRMVGSSNSIADCNVVLNTAVAESLRQFADILEKSEDFRTELNQLIRGTIQKHKRIIFNGNGYDDAWIREATEERGLLNLRTTPDALPYFLSAKNVRLFRTHRVYTEKEMRSRYEIILENYCKTIRIEAATMVDMVYKHFLPAITSFAKDVAEAGNAKKALFDGIDLSYELETVKKLSSLTAAISRSVRELEEELDRADTITDVTNQAFTFKDKVITKMAELRSAVDEVEHITSAKNWPFPNYSELLFGVR